MSDVIHIKDIAEQQALKNLNRVTGLTFDSFPVSLVNQQVSEGRLDAGDRIRQVLGAFHGLHK